MHTQNNVHSRAKFRLNNRNMTLLFISKRIVDVIVSLVLLCLLTPIMLIIIVKLYKEEGRPIFYRQLKRGRNDRTFLMWTFRTMTHPSQVIRMLPQETKSNLNYDKGKTEFGLITTTGLWLRKYRLHKIPQLFNVLKGEMSLVGFKGEALDNKMAYLNWSKRVKPGMTGYIKKDSEQYCDMYYMENISFQLENIIVLQTVTRVIKRLFIKRSTD